MKAIDRDHLKTICKIGQGAACCRYIVGGHEGITCAKNEDIGRLLDRRVALKLMKAQGDNCPGYGVSP